MGADRDSLAADAFDGLKPASAAADDVRPGSPASLDSTLPPTALRDLLAADGATVFVLSADQELMRTVAQASEDQYPIHPVADWTDLVDAAAARRAHVVLLDADRLPVALPEAVATLHEVAPDVIVLVAATRDAAQPVMGLLSARKVHRLLIKPATHGITRLLLESAVGRYLQLRDQQAPPAALVDDMRPPRRHRRPKASWSAWPLATALVTATVGAVVVSEMYDVQWRAALDRVAGGAEVEHRSEPQSAEPSRGQRAEPAAARTVRAVEGEAATADAGDGLVAPPAPVVARSDEPIVIASAAPLSSSGGGLSSAEISTVPRLADERRDTLQPLPTLAPDAPPAAEPDLAAPPVDGLAALLDLIDARLADGRLLTADSDSAKAYFEQALRLNPLDPRLLARRAALAAGLVDAAHDAVAREDFAAAQRLAEEAFRLGAERAALARLDSELESARTLARHAEALSAARALLRQGRLLDANGEGALARLAALRRERSTVAGLAGAWRELTEAVAANVRAAIAAGDFAAASSWASALAIDGGDPARAAELEFEARQAELLAMPIPAGELGLVEAPALVYPDEALADGDEGWVDVEFIVDREGRPRDITVIDSRRGRRFVDAAIEAVAGHRYAPFVLDGRIYERRARTRVRFELQ